MADGSQTNDKLGMRRKLKGLAIAGALLSISVFGAYFYSFPNGVSSDQMIWGAFGDFVGGSLNPILAFLSFLALLWTISIQSEELRDTRLELERSAKAHTDSALLMEQQTQNQLRQNFETTFFSLFEILVNEIKSITEIPKEGSSIAASQHGKVFKTILHQHGIDTASQYISKPGSELYVFIALLFELLKIIEVKTPSSLNKDDYYGLVLSVIDGSIKQLLCIYLAGYSDDLIHRSRYAVNSRLLDSIDFNTHNATYLNEAMEKVLVKGATGTPAHPDQ